MPRKSKNPSDVLRSKPDKLDWATFNLLENLLVFCVEKSRSVPKESGVKFGISVHPKDKSICLLFKTDRERDPLIREENVPRADYLAFYTNGVQCICTIIEMKGGGKKAREHGIEQITALRDVLRLQIRDHLPGRFRKTLSFQGILLTFFNQQIPLEAIKRAEKDGLVILPLQYDRKAELFPYVSKLNSLFESNKLTRYKHTEPAGDRDFTRLETLLARGALHKRLNDGFFAANFDHHTARRGMYLDYVHDDDAYAVLLVKDRSVVIAIKEQGSNLSDMISEELDSLGIRTCFSNETID